jgi:hypothetical protein
MAFEDELPTTPGMEEYLTEIKERDHQEEVRSRQALEELDALGGQGSDAEVARRSMNPNPALGSREYEAGVAELIAGGASPERPGFQGTPGQMAGQRPELSLGDTSLQDPTAGFGQAGGFGIQQPAAPAPAEEEPGVPSITDKDYAPSRKYKGRYRAEKESADIAAQQKADIAETQKGFHASAAEERLAAKQEAAKRDAAYIKDRAQVDEAAEKMAREGMAKRQAMLDDINNTKIDADYFGKSDVGGKVGMVLMAALGGLVQRRGEQNQGVALIQKMIDRDIRTQQANLSKKKWAAGQQVGIYQDSLQIEKDKGKAMDMAHARYWTVVGNKINAINSKYGDKAKTAGFDLLAVQAREKRDEALLKIKGQEQREGVAWYNAKTGRIRVENQQKQFEAKQKAERDAAAAAKRVSIEQAAQEGHSIEAAPDSDMFGGAGYRTPLTEPSGKVDEKGNAIMQQRRDKAGNLLWGKTKSFKIGKLRPELPTAAKTAAHNEVTANHTIFRQIASLKRRMREKTKISPGFMRSDEARALVQEHLNLAVITMHAASGAQTTDKEYHRWTTELIAGPNKVWQIFKGDPMLALEAFEKTKYDRHRTLVRSNYTDVNEHWMQNMQEYYSPTVHRVSGQMEGPARDLMKSIESGDVDQAGVALKGLVGKTEESVFKGATDEGLDRESTYQGVVAQLEAVDEQAGRPAWQPPKGPEPTDYKGKGSPAIGKWAEEAGVTPDPKTSRLKAHRGKRKSAVGMRTKRGRISGAAKAMRVNYAPAVGAEGVWKFREFSPFPDGKPPEWMNPKEIKQVEAAFEKSYNATVKEINKWRGKTERRGRVKTGREHGHALRKDLEWKELQKKGMAEMPTTSYSGDEGRDWNVTFQDPATKYEPVPGTPEYKRMLGNRRFAQERKLKLKKSRR